MLAHLHQYIIWLKRIHLSRGFGVQSPFAYSFIRYVISEHYPYYEYSRLLSEQPKLSNIKKKLCLLYFRIANFAQADSWMVLNNDSSLYERFIKAGCHKTKVIGSVLNSDSAGVVCVQSLIEDKESINTVLKRATKSTILIIEGIYKDKDIKAEWLRLIQSERVILSFDLYYCGILLFDKEFVKQNYIVNF